MFYFCCACKISGGKSVFRNKKLPTVQFCFQMQKQPEVERLNFLVFMTEQLFDGNRLKNGYFWCILSSFIFHGFLNDCLAFNV